VVLRCTAVRIPFALYAFALVVRGLLFALHPDAAYPDSYYYVAVARSLESGHGFNVDFIWSFVDVGGRIPAGPTLPIPSNGHWMPLASLVQLPTIWLLGPTPLASSLPFILIGALAAPMTWALAREIGAADRIALAAGIAVAAPAATALYMTQPDNFALFQVLGTAALWLVARGLRGSGRAFALAGLAVGLATLARNDGVLLGAAAALIFFWERWRRWRSRHAAARRPAIGWRWAFACFGLFLLATAPWYLRQLAVFGSVSPSSGSGRILFIARYEDMWSVTGDTSLGGLFAQGLGPLLASRVLGLLSAVENFSVLACTVLLAPFVLWAVWLRRSSVDYRPFFVYACLLFGAAGLLFAVHVPYGTFLHSAVALIPYTYILGLDGVAAVVTWLTPRRKGWTKDRAVRMFLAAAVGTVLLNAAVFAYLANRSWNYDRDLRLAAGAALTDHGAAPSDLLLSADPGGYEYFTGHGGVVTPYDSLDVIHQVAADYGTRWLVLERNHIVPAMVPVLEGKSRPDWIGPPVFEVPYAGDPSGDPDQDAAPALALYPICLSAGDPRCAAGATP
jgi:hypothetical protein